MAYPKGTKIIITKIMKKDYSWFDGEFEYLSKMMNGKEALISSYNDVIPEFGERESYQIIVDFNGEEKDFEIEFDEFIVL